MVSPAGDPVGPSKSNTNSVSGALLKQHGWCCTRLSKSFPYTGSGNWFTDFFTSSLRSKASPRWQTVTLSQARPSLRSPKAGIWQFHRDPALLYIPSELMSQKHCREAHTNRAGGWGWGQEDGHYPRNSDESLRSQGHLPSGQEEDAFDLALPYLVCLPRLRLGHLTLHLSSHPHGLC